MAASIVGVILGILSVFRMLVWPAMVSEVKAAVVEELRKAPTHTDPWVIRYLESLSETIAALNEKGSEASDRDRSRLWKEVRAMKARLDDR